MLEFSRIGTNWRRRPSDVEVATINFTHFSEYFPQLVDTIAFWEIVRSLPLGTNHGDMRVVVPKHRLAFCQQRPEQ
jgi:hypothetical protein